MNRCFKDRSLQSYNLQEKTTGELTLINKFAYYSTAMRRPGYYQTQGNIKISTGRQQLDQTEMNSETQWNELVD